MIQVNVTKVSTGQVGWSGVFLDSTAANAWIAQEQANNSWGKPARTLVANEQGYVTDIDGSIPDLTKAISTGTQTDIFNVTVNTYTFAADYTISQADISAQVAQQAAIQSGLDRQAVGASIIAAIFALNEAKMIAGSMSTATLQALMQDSNVSLIRELLWAGSLTTAKAMITAYNGAYFTSSDVAAILPMLSSY